MTAWDQAAATLSGKKDGHWLFIDPPAAEMRQGRAPWPLLR